MTDESSQQQEPDLPPAWLQPGEVICSRFKILKHLGSGTVGRAFLCHDSVADDVVVCKVAKEPTSNGGLVRREYRTLVALRSVALPYPKGYFEHVIQDDRWPVLAIEQVEGIPLQIWVNGRSAREKLGVLADLGTELAAISSHQAEGHGDLWEGNVMVSASGKVRLIDPDGASLGRSTAGAGTPMQDIGAYCLLLSTLIAPPDDRAIKATVARLTGGEGSSLNLSDIARHLRMVLDHPLPSEMGGRIQGLASIISADRGARQKMYCRIRDIRDLEYRALFERVHRVLEPFGCVPSAESQVVDLYREELAGQDKPKGSLWHRTRQFIAPDGEEFYLSFDGPSDFRKPWPYPDREGLICPGWANVLADGKPVATSRLELWLLQDDPQIFITQGNRHIRFDHGRLERLAHVLVGVTLPALAEPFHNETPQHFLPATYVERESYFSQLGLEHRPDLFLKNLAHVTLQLPSQQNLKGAGELGSQLFRFFDTPKVNRLRLVQGVGELLTRVVGVHLRSVYSIDVVDADEVNRTLRVAMEAREERGPTDVNWTFDLSFPRGEFIAPAAPALGPR